MKMLRRAKIGVLVLSWYPPHLKDEHGPPIDDMVKNILNIASTYKIKIAFHIEPYEERNPLNLRENLKVNLLKHLIYKFNSSL